MPSFLPQYPFVTSPLLLFGLLLLAGVIGGEVMKRVLALPRIVGYVLVGLALGASGLNWLDAKMVREAWIFVDMALGLILFELGRRLDFVWLKREPWLAATGVLESVLAFACVFFALLYFDVKPLLRGGCRVHRDRHVARRDPGRGAGAESRRAGHRAGAEPDRDKQRHRLRHFHHAARVAAP